MLASLIAPALARRGIHYGWVMVALTFLVALSSAGALGVLGALLLPLQAETGWDTASISGALALRLLLFGLMAPFAAALLQRYGLWRVTFLICGLSTNGLIQTHFIPLCSDFGMAQVEAASVLALMGVFDFIGTIASGWLSDRYDNRRLLFWYYGLRGLSLLMLPSSTFSLYGLSLFAVFYGLDWIATVPPTVRLAGQAFGRERAPLVFGWVFTGHQLGAAIAALGAGLSRDALASYLPAFYIAGAACLLAALLALGAAPKRKAASGAAAA